jgi:hypothetical protein
MAISFIGRTSGGAVNSGAITLTLPGGMAAGDLIIVCHGVGDATDLAMPAMTTAGYTDVGTSEQYANGTTNDANQKTWYKYHVADTTAVTAVGGGGTDSGCSSACMVFRGVASAAQGGPFSTTPTKATGTGGTGANPPSIATAAGDWVVIAGTAAAGTTGTATLPTGYTTNAEPGTQGTDTIDATTAMGYKAAPGNPEDPGALVFSGGTSAADAWCAITMALKEAPAAPPGGVKTFVLFGPAMRRGRW